MSGLNSRLFWRQSKPKFYYLVAKVYVILTICNNSLGMFCKYCHFPTWLSSKVLMFFSCFLYHDFLKCESDVKQKTSKQGKGFMLDTGY